jgi:adenine/guanine phosphoribosyltransferase-like PRPP-binding protein
VLDDIYATGGTIQSVVNILEKYGIRNIELEVVEKLNNIPDQKKRSYPLYTLVDFDK